MKKYIKYLSSFLLMFVALISSVSAVTITETLIEGDGYSTIEDGSIVIGVTKFHSDVVVTGGRATKAGSDAAVIHLKLNGNLDDFETPVIYVYAGGAWFALDKNNDASVVEDQAILDDLSNKDIYYVNDDEKLLDIDVSGFEIDTTKLPKGVTYKDGKIWVKATKDSVTIFDKDGAEYKFVKDRGLWGLDQSECYEVNGREITGYSNTCSKNVIIPSKVGDTEIVSVGADAFRNKGIKTVIIPNHIISLGDKSFADNELTHVTIENKYDESDFDYYGDNVFGSFKDEDIIWKNELTDFVNQFNDEITLNVTKEAIEQSGDDLFHVLAKYSELERLGLVEDENGYINSKFHVSFNMYDVEEKVLILNASIMLGDRENTNQMTRDGDFSGDYSVHKEIKYTLNVVDEENDDYLSIRNEYKDYLDSIKKKIENKDFKDKLTGYDGLINIADKYNYDVIFGYYRGSSEVETSKNVGLVYNGILHYAYDARSYEIIKYDVEIDDGITDEEEIYLAMLEKFEEETNISNFEVDYSYFYNSADGIEYIVYVTDTVTGNDFYITYKAAPKRGELILLNEWENSMRYAYYPEVSYQERGGKLTEYFQYAFEELNQKYNTGTDYIFENHFSFSSEINEDGLYDTIYSTFVNTTIEEKDVTIYIITNNAKETMHKEEFFLSKIEITDDMTNVDYEAATLTELLEDKKLTDYYTKGANFYNTYYYNENTGKYEYAYNIENVQKYKGYEVYDFSTNTTYIVLYKDFEDREPGTLYLKSSTEDQYGIHNHYGYIPSKKYTSGKFIDYINEIKQELMEKVNCDEMTNNVFWVYDRQIEKVEFRLSLSTYDNSGEKAVDNNYEIRLEYITSTQFENYYYKPEINVSEYSTIAELEDALYNSYIDSKEISDYYYFGGFNRFIEVSNGEYKEFEEGVDSPEELLIGYILYDFENEREVYILINASDKESLAQ